MQCIRGNIQHIGHFNPCPTMYSITDGHTHISTQEFVNRSGQVSSHCTCKNIHTLIRISIKIHYSCIDIRNKCIRGGKRFANSKVRIITSYRVELTSQCNFGSVKTLIQNSRLNAEVHHVLSVTSEMDSIGCRGQCTQVVITNITSILIQHHCTKSEIFNGGHIK
ncbi:hypothetical protein D3C85_979490 [compost metagenome]